MIPRVFYIVSTTQTCTEIVLQHSHGNCKNEEIRYNKNKEKASASVKVTLLKTIFKAEIPEGS